MAKDASHTFSTASKSLVALLDFFLWESSSPPWATMGQIMAIMPAVWWMKVAIKVKNAQIRQ